MQGIDSTSVTPYFVENFYMKKLFVNSTLGIFLFLTSFITVCAQNSNKDLDEMHRQMDKQRASLDSSMKKMDTLLQHQSKSYDSSIAAQQIETNNRNLNSFLGDMKEREQKEKQRMWMRIGFGLLLLVVGIIGMRRKSKVKK